VGKKSRVRAAGGVIWRSFNGEREVLIVHRPHYDDWSFPKGKHDAGETDLACAIREVVEETGFTVVIGPALPTLAYLDHKGRDKTVAYWAMTLTPDCVADVFVVNEEVDSIRWVTESDAVEFLTYDIDKLLLGSLDEALRGEAGSERVVISQRV
jgi:8-oxo-dGTP pyrophosphatase MutT (NUDIX family)